MDDIEVEWTFCPECGVTVIAYPEYVVEAAIGGRLGDEQVDMGVEHECNPL